MKKIYLAVLLAATQLVTVLANENKETIQDAEYLQPHPLEEVVVSGSTKETNDLKTLPMSVSFLTPRMLEGQNISSIKNLSSIVPNFFIADYGSRLSSPVYIRGIGERSTGQSIGMYVDNMPLPDKSVFDFNFTDISLIEVLRGPQGTLYGRNAMSGIINISTQSPLDIQRTRIGLTAGNYGLLRAKAGTSFLLNKDLGVSLNGYYDGHDGFFTNSLTGKSADAMKSGGGRLRIDWRITPQWTARLTTAYDYSDQGAFPYGSYDGGKIAAPSYNVPGSYIRETISSGLNLQYRDSRILFNSSTGFLHFNDRMNMDIDYGSVDKFTLFQRQKENAYTQELSIKSNTKHNYQWSFGAFGFYNNLNTNVVTTMGEPAIAEYLQPMLPPFPPMTITDERIPIPGSFGTPSYGGAIFHQSTYNNLFTEGLSVTAGIRVDYEKAKLDYDTSFTMNMEVFSRPAVADTIMQGKLSTSFTEVLPKIALKYELDSRNYVYATVGNGYKTGGYNIQNFADIARTAIRAKYDSSIGGSSVEEQTFYKPEYSWNYEMGYKGELVKDILYAELALFYIDVKDIQITEFVESSHGRIVKNAGKAKSLGFDLALQAYLTHELNLSANYGFAHATFKDYRSATQQGEVDYGGNHIPFAPQNTLSLGAVYNKALTNCFVDRFHIQAYYNASGRIYWTEVNDVYQDFYGLLNLKAGVSKGIVDVNLWVNNLLNTDYTAFYFETDSDRLGQAGKPITFGVDVSVSF